MNVFIKTNFPIHRPNNVFGHFHKLRFLVFITIVLFLRDLIALDDFDMSYTRYYVGNYDLLISYYYKTEVIEIEISDVSEKTYCKPSYNILLQTVYRISTQRSDVFPESFRI